MGTTRVRRVRAWAGAGIAGLATLILGMTLIPAAAAVDRRPEFVIASIGDSYAAGEGTPIRAGSFNAEGILQSGGSEEAWGGFAGLGSTYDFAGDTAADLCHRSRNAGAAVAAKTLQDRYPGIHVVFRSFACSGATIPSGLIGPYGGADAALAVSRPDQLPQIQQLDSFIAGRANRNLDALVVGIGGNDLGFAGIVAMCLLPHERAAVLGAGLGTVVSFALGGPILGYSFAPTAAILGGIAGNALAGCDGWGIETTVLDVLIPNVQDAYADLDQAIGGTRAGPANVRLRFTPDEVYLTEYPDPTHDENGAFCDGTGFPDGEVYANITRDEARWVFEEALARINAAVRDGATAQGWTYVGGIQNAFRRHGVCSTSSWFNQNNASLRRQGADLLVGYPLLIPSQVASRIFTASVFGRHLSGGVAHPSVDGQAEYGRRIFTRLEQQLLGRFGITVAPVLTVARYHSSPPSPQDAYKLRLTWTAAGIAAPILRWEVRNGKLATARRPISIPQPAGGATPSYVHTGVGSYTFTVRACGHVGCGPWSAPVRREVP
ncbi:MAG: hypothetical protein AB1416_11095 [Actinomycetota bacterium]